MLLSNSSYAQDLSVQDGTAVAHISQGEPWAFEADGATPSARLCEVFDAWNYLIDAVKANDKLANVEPFRYDIVNVGREVVAQLAGRFGKNFTSALAEIPLDRSMVEKTSESYVKILEDIDTLVACDEAFLLGPWLRKAKAWSQNSDGTLTFTDCTTNGSFPAVDAGGCEAYYEWNARVQLTTWNPVKRNATVVPSGPVDYAGKHWSGLIRDYYAKRVQLIAARAIEDAVAGRSLDNDAIERIKAEHAYNWTTARNLYAENRTENLLVVMEEVMHSYDAYFSTCAR